MHDGAASTYVHVHVYTVHDGEREGGQGVLRIAVVYMYV